MTFRALSVGCALVACLVGMGTEVFSTPPSPYQQVFRAGATLVRVDAYPRRDGRIVEDLTAKDFQIFENGKLQAVETFEFVKVPPHTPDADLRDPTSVADMLRQAADPRNRIFVMYLDPVHTTMFDSISAQGALQEFISRVLGPTDLFGLMTPDMPVNALTLGRRREVIDSILSTPWGLVGNPAATMPRNRGEERVYSCFGPEGLMPYRRHLMITTLEALVPYMGTLRDERKNLLLVTGELRINFFDTGMRSMGGGSGGGIPFGRGGGIPTVGVGPGGQLGIGGTERREGSRDSSGCDALAASMQGMSFGERFKNLLESARNANVSIYPIDTGGLRVVDAGVTDSLRTVAENTDGSVVLNTNDLRAGVRKIADELSAYYLLGYYTTNAKDDGLFRRIEVKTALRGVDVSARKGYFAPTEEMRKAETAARAAGPRPPSPAAEAVGALSRLRPDARVYAHGLASDRGLDVAVEIAGREIEAGRWRDGADLSVSVTGPAGSAVTATARIDAGARGAIVHVPLPAAPGAGPLAVTVTVASGAEKDEQRLDVARASARVVEAPLVYRATPSPRSPLRAVAEFQFRRTERVHLEWTVRAAPSQRTARLLNAQGQPLAVPIVLGDRTDAGGAVITGDLLLTAIPPGDYVVELSAEHDGVSETRLTAFRLVR